MLRFSLIFLIILSSLLSKSQDNLNDNSFNKNRIYWYAGTTLVCWSTGVFYERNIVELEKSSLYARVGTGLYAFLWGDSGHYFSANIGHVLGKNKNHFEYNLGYAKYEVFYGEYSYNYPSAYIGYRYHKPDKGFIFRTGFGWPEQLSFSIGGSF